MSRMLLAFSLLLGLALAGADWYAERGRGSRAQVPSYEGGTPIHAPAPSDQPDVTMMEGGTPIPPPPK
jgi:hypothetical protein